MTATAADSTVRALTPARLFGIEIYRGPDEVALAMTEASGACGIIGIWTDRSG